MPCGWTLSLSSVAAESWHEKYLHASASQRYTTFVPAVVSQFGIPVDVSVREVTREKSLGGALSLCAKAAGYEGKEVCDLLKMDKGQWSRWESGAEGVVWPKLTVLMDKCGNDAPLLWMLHDRGYDANSLHKRETETEKKLRLANDEIARLKAEYEVTVRVLRELRS
jgi:hypothetical protein